MQEKKSCLATLPRKSIFRIQSIHTGIFCHVFCMTFWCQTWKSFEFNLLSFEARTKITWAPANLHDCYSEQHVVPKKRIYKWFNSNFFYSCDCPFFVNNIRQFSYFEGMAMWSVCTLLFVQTVNSNFFAFLLPVLTFDFLFWTLPVRLIPFANWD